MAVAGITTGPRAARNPAGLSPIIAGAWRLADWQWSPQQRLAWIEGNLDIGVTSFAHPDSVGSSSVEALFGEAMALRPALRSRLQLVSQCGLPWAAMAAPVHSGHQGHHDTYAATLAAHVRTSVEQSLQALRTDHLDLLLVYHPDAPRNADGLVEAASAASLDVLADAVEALRREGKVRTVGVSNFRPAQLAALHQRVPLATHQIALSPLQRRALHDGVLDQCQQLGLRPMAWSPLAGGRIFITQDTATQRLRSTLQALADERGISVTTLLIAWVLHLPSQPLPILGSRRIGVAQDAMAALPLQLGDQAWQQICTAASGCAAPST